MDKSPEAFRTISEVADDLDLPQHVLRFWETRFAQIKPLKRGGGRRYYRPDDIDLLRGIRRLLYGEGYTIKGVQRILRDQGLRHVAALGRATVIEAEEMRGEPSDARLPEPPPMGGPELYAPPAERALAAGPREPSLPAEASPKDFAPPSVRESAPPPQPEPELVASDEEPEDDSAPEVRPPTPEDELEFRHRPPPTRAPPVASAAPMPAPPDPPPPPVASVPAAPETPLPAPHLLAAATPARPPLPRRDPEITAEALRRLRATLFELSECKRLLEEARQG
jgi:DNA-binding transcriptional MerR regulator